MLQLYNVLYSRMTLLSTILNFMITTFALLANKIWAIMDHSRSSLAIQSWLRLLLLENHLAAVVGLTSTSLDVIQVLVVLSVHCDAIIALAFFFT